MSDLLIFDALNYLRKYSPHIFSILELCNIKLKADIPTACVSWEKSSKKFNIDIGPKFYENLDSKNLSAIIEHEAYHVLFRHLFDDKLKDKNLANIAQDAIINDCIKLFRDNKNDILLDNRVKLKEINKAFNIENNTSHDVYKYLEQNKNDIKDLLDKLLDDHSALDNDDEGISEIDKAIIKEALKNTIKSNKESFEKIGNQSADVDRLVKEALKVEYNFKNLFSYAVKKSLKADQKRTWKKVNRRYGSDAKGKKKAIKPNVLLLVDTSGSITDEILSMVNYQISYLSKFYDFTVCWGDTKLHGHDKIKRGQKPNITFKGGGGTNLNFYKKVPDYQNFDLIVFNTDGFIEPIDSDCKINKLFCIFPHGRHVDGYKNIDIR